MLTDSWKKKEASLKQTTHILRVFVKTNDSDSCTCDVEPLPPPPPDAVILCTPPLSSGDSGIMCDDANDASPGCGGC